MLPGRYMASSAVNNLPCVIKCLLKHHDKIHTAYSQQSARCLMGNFTQMNVFI